MAQALDLVVDGAVLFDEGVRVGDVRLRLIVVIVGHEVFHGVFREEGPELLAQLGARVLLWPAPGGPLDPLDDLGHGIGLAAAGDAQQHLVPQAVFDAAGQGVDGLGLVPLGVYSDTTLNFPISASRMQYSVVVFYCSTIIFICKQIFSNKCSGSGPGRRACVDKSSRDAAEWPRPRYAVSLFRPVTRAIG